MTARNGIHTRQNSMTTLPEYPPAMTDKEKRAWDVLVADYPASHFTKSDSGSILQYVRVCMRLDKLIACEGDYKEVVALSAVKAKLCIYLRVGPSQRMSQKVSEDARKKMQATTLDDAAAGAEAPGAAWKTRVGLRAV